MGSQASEHGRLNKQQANKTQRSEPVRLVPVRNADSTRHATCALKTHGHTLGKLNVRFCSKRPSFALNAQKKERSAEFTGRGGGSPAPPQAGRTPGREGYSPSRRLDGRWDGEVTRLFSPAGRTPGWGGHPAFPARWTHARTRRLSGFSPAGWTHAGMGRSTPPPGRTPAR